MVYTVGEMARLLDVSASTLRYYDKEGLFRSWSVLPAQTHSAGIRFAGLRRVLFRRFAEKVNRGNGLHGLDMNLAIEPIEIS